MRYDSKSISGKEEWLRYVDLVRACATHLDEELKSELYELHMIKLKNLSDIFNIPIRRLVAWYNFYRFICRSSKRPDWSFPRKLCQIDLIYACRLVFDICPYIYRLEYNAVVLQRDIMQVNH